MMGFASLYPSDRLAQRISCAHQPCALRTAAGRLRPRLGPRRFFAAGRETTASAFLAAGFNHESFMQIVALWGQCLCIGVGVIVSSPL
jgi:hypothetical protein